MVILNRIVYVINNKMEVMIDIKKIKKYLDEQVGHFTDLNKITKLKEEVDELRHEIVKHSPEYYGVLDECCDVSAIAYHIASRHGFMGTPDDMLEYAYNKMKKRIESGERDYKNRDF